jgi:hypothetical protein
MKQFVVAISILLITLASSWALLRTQFFRGHDYIHAARIAEMTQALEDGHFPVRWTQNFGYGYGMPLFEFYAPLPYYAGSFLYWLGLPIVPTVQALFLLGSLLTAWGAYKLGSVLFGRAGGVLTAAMVTLAPYRAVNLFVRGALSEAWGIMAMPWVLYGVVQVVRRQKRGWLTLVLSLVALMLSHNIMTLLFVPLSLLFAALYMLHRYHLDKKDYQWLNVGGTLIGSYLLAIGLSAFYMIPAMIEKNETQIGSIFSGYFHYSHHFLYIRQFFTEQWGFTGSVWGPEDGISFFLGFGQIVGLTVVTVLAIKEAIVLIRKKQLATIFTRKSIMIATIAGILLDMTLFMSLLKSKFLWDVLPLISFAQFPWRFLGPGTVFAGLMVGASVLMIKKKNLRYGWVIFAVLLTMINAKYFQPESFMTNNDDLYYTDADRIQREMSGILPDYIPVGLDEKIVQPVTRVTCTVFNEPLEQYCDDRLSIVIDRVHEILVSTKSMDSETIHFAVTDFPGWKVEVDGQPVEKKVSEWGTIMVEIPPGEHMIGVYFGSTPVRLWSDIVSALSLVILVGLLVPTTKPLGKKHD